MADRINGITSSSAKRLWLGAWLILAVGLAVWLGWTSTESYRRLVDLGLEPAERFALDAGDVVLLVFAGLFLSAIVVGLAHFITGAVSEIYARAKAFDAPGLVPAAASHIVNCRPRQHGKPEGGDGGRSSWPPSDHPRSLLIVSRSTRNP